MLPFADADASFDVTLPRRLMPPRCCHYFALRRLFDDTYDAVVLMSLISAKKRLLLASLLTPCQRFHHYIGSSHIYA